MGAVAETEAVIRRSSIDAVVFDMDGVVTQTADVHAAAWKRLFDAYLQQRAQRSGEPFRPFDVRADYLPHVDGKPRFDGVRDFLASRGIELPWGDAGDPPGDLTVCALGNLKNAHFDAEVREHGVKPFPTTVELIDRLRRVGIRTAIITASANAGMVLEAAGVRQLFEAQVDGALADELDLRGKPDPAVFVEAARRLGVQPRRAAVVEDAIAGVQAGRGGGFALVIGVDRGGNAAALRRHGADVVVGDLAEVTVTP